MKDLHASHELGLDRLAAFSPDGGRVAVVQGADGVAVHDAADGRRVASRPSERLSPDVCAVAWDLSRVPAGVYWARLEASGVHVARRVVVIE